MVDDRHASERWRKHFVAEDTDAAGNTGTSSPVTFTLEEGLVPVIAVQAAATLVEGQTTPISAGLSETGALNSEYFTVTVTDASGTLQASSPYAAVVSGSGMTSLTISGSLSEVSGALSTLTDTDSVPARRHYHGECLRQPGRQPSAAGDLDCRAGAVRRREHAQL